MLNLFLLDLLVLIGQGREREEEEVRNDKLQSSEEEASSNCSINTSNHKQRADVELREMESVTQRCSGDDSKIVLSRIMSLRRKPPVHGAKLESNRIRFFFTSK